MTSLGVAIYLCNSPNRAMCTIVLTGDQYQSEAKLTALVRSAKRLCACSGHGYLPVDVCSIVTAWSESTERSCKRRAIEI